MELHQLRYFVAAAEAGSISRAATRCGVAQPSLSQQIRRLERSLGVALFDRLGRGVALTEEGSALLPRARRILAEVGEAEASLRGEGDAGAGRLSVGAIPTIAPYVLPGVLAALREGFPQCELGVREDLTEHLLEQVADNQLDVAVLSTPSEHRLVDVEIVGQEAMLVVVAADGPVEATGEITLDELRDLPRVSLHEMHCLGRQIAGFCSMRRVGAHVVCRTTQLQTVLELVRMGLGVSIVPEMAARSDASGERRYARLRDDEPTRQIAVAWRSGRSRSRIATRFAVLVGEALAGGSS